MSDVLVPLGFFATIVAVVVGLPIARAYARKLDQQAKTPSLPAGEILARLDRIEQGVDAMSTEVERISEGQRFTTKLLAERTEERPPLSLPAQDSGRHS